MIQTIKVFLFGMNIGIVQLKDNGFCAFQYTQEFCRTGLQPAPIMMPTLPDRTYIFQNISTQTFNGLPGMIADSLPDSFGQALLNQWLTLQGRSEGEANVIEKLSYQGQRAMGALEYVPAREQYLQESSKIEIESLIDTARIALESKENFKSCFDDKEQAIYDILKIGTSAGGQRAKAVIAINPETNEIRSGQVAAPEGFEYWLIKFDGFDSNAKPVNPANYGRREFAFHKCILDAGISMTPCRLLEENGRAHFMTKRFDRTNSGKVHMQTLCALGHFDFRSPGAYSYEQAFSLQRKLGLNYPEAEQLFRRMLFNVFSVNMDDHTKNISYLMDNNGKWSLSPAYDMGLSYNPNGQWANKHQMTLNGKSDNFEYQDLIAIALKNDIDKPAHIIDEVESAVHNFPKYAEEIGIPRQENDMIMKIINEKTSSLRKNICLAEGPHKKQTQTLMDNDLERMKNYIEKKTQSEEIKPKGPHQ